MSSYPLPRFFPSQPSSSSSSSTTAPSLRNHYQMNYHHAHQPPMYYPFSPPFDGSVNLNNPYIYDPTHVKHRRRTTPEQLKVLEETFKTDPKPNPSLRKRLSLELGMTPRVLQVWFQNRRMKVKRLVKKQSSPTDQSLADSATNDFPNGQQQSEDSPSSTPPSNATTAIATGSDASTAPASASASTPIPTPPSGSSSSSPAPSPSSPLPYPDLSRRRSSLPLTVGFNSGSNHHASFHNLHQQQQHQSLDHYPHHGMSWNHAIDDNSTSENAIHHNGMASFSADGNVLAFDPLTDPLLLRRRSFTSLHRLESHPFAPLVAAGNGVALPLPMRRSQSPFLLPPEASSTSPAHPKSHIDASVSGSSPDPPSVDNISGSSAAVSFLSDASPTLPETAVTTTSADAPDKATENGFPASLGSDGSGSLNGQCIPQKHSGASHRPSPASGAKILESGAVLNADSTENNMDGLGTTTDAILGPTNHPEGIHQHHDYHDGLRSLVNPQRQVSTIPIQQPPPFLQRSQSTSQVRPFIGHHHSSSTPPQVFTNKASQARGYNLASVSGGISSHATHFSHLTASVPMGVVQHGFRSASFHGIIPDSDNYHAYYNRQILVGQGPCIPKSLGIGYGQHPSSARRPHSTSDSLQQQQQFINVSTRDHAHMGLRSISSASIPDYSNPRHNTGIAIQGSQSYQYPHNSSHSPTQFKEPEVDIPATHPPYAFPPRPLGALPPGPLPASGYSFGTATSSRTDTDSEMHEKQNDIQDDKQLHTPWDTIEVSSGIDVLNHIRHTAEPSNASACDGVERGYQTRFGSSASVMSMPSVPSVSEGSGATADYELDWELEGFRGTTDGRRGSCTGQVAELFSNLEVGSRRGSEESIHSLHSAHSLNTPDGLPHHNVRSRDPGETRELSYPVPDISFCGDRRSHEHENETEAVVDAVVCENEYSNKKDECGHDEDRRTTPSAQPAMGTNTTSDASRNSFQHSQIMNVSGSKGVHGDQVTPAYLQIQSAYYPPVSNFYNSGIGTEYAISEFADVAIHDSMGMGMNLNMGVGLGEQFQYQGVNVDYIPQESDRFRTNTDDNMLGVERYTGMTEGSYDEAY